MKVKRKAAPPTEARLEFLRLPDLEPNPDQNEYFPAYGAQEYAVLKADIEANGLRTPIEVLPPRNAAGLPAFTILSGHTRREILIALGLVESQVRVRYDLQHCSRSEVDEIFISDNYARRQLEPLDRARVAVRLFQIEREKRGHSAVGDPQREGELRDRIGEILGVSGRNLARYLNILDSSTEVQRAFQANRLTLVEASRVRTLSTRDRLRFAGRLSDGEDVMSVYADFFPARDGQHLKPSDALQSFVRSLDKAHADLADRVESLHPNQVRRSEAELRRGRKLIRTLLKKSSRTPNKSCIQSVRSTFNKRLQELLCPIPVSRQSESNTGEASGRPCNRSCPRSSTCSARA